MKRKRSMDPATVMPSSRAGHIYRMGSPSIRQRNATNFLNQRLAETALGKIESLVGFLIMAIKSEGSNLVPGRHALIIPANDDYAPKPDDAFKVEPREDGSLTLVVEDTKIINPDMQAQIAAFQQETSK